MNTQVSRSRDNLTTSQIPPVASVAPVTHTIAQQAVSQPQQHIQTQQINVSNANMTTNTVTSAQVQQHHQQQQQQTVNITTICHLQFVT